VEGEQEEAPPRSGGNPLNDELAIPSGGGGGGWGAESESVALVSPLLLLWIKTKQRMLSLNVSINHAHLTTIIFGTKITVSRRRKELKVICL